MLHIFRIAVLFLTIFLFIPCQGQTKDTLQEVLIIREKRKPYAVDSKENFTAGQQRQRVDTALRSFYHMQSLAQLVAGQSTAFVKAYGVNGAATLSFRGASSAQSAVYWNGIPLSGSSLGMLDISLLNAGLFDDVSLQYGSSSALFGSGNVGGALLLDDQLPDFSPRKQLNFSMGAGSFKRKNLSMNALFENKRLRVKGNVFYQYAQNNFSYVDRSQIMREMENAENAGLGGVLALDYNLNGKGGKPGSGHLLSARLWYQRYNREIPPALFESSSEKKQEDRSFKSMVHWQKKQRRSDFYAKLSYIKDHLSYRDNMIAFENENDFNQLYAEAGWGWQVSNPEKRSFFTHHILVFTPLHYGVSVSKDANKMEQWRYAVAAAYKLQSHHERLIVNASIRQELVDHKSISLPGGSILYKAFKMQWNSREAEIHLRGNVQKTYRTPSLNELYFSPGGNENLKPERGWSEDAGFVFKYMFRQSSGAKRNTGSFLLENETSVFNRNIQDWIYWLGGAIWTPHNLAEVHSRGIETDNRLVYESGKAKFQLTFKTAYVLSTTQKSYMPDDGSLGKQIPYAPRYSAQANIGFQYDGFFVNYNHLYSGYRFITVDESQFLKPYSIGNIQAWYRFNLKAVGLKAMFQVLNAGNKSYEIVGGRPMPGRHFFVGLEIAI